MGINPGELRSRIDIQASTATSDGAGGSTKSWSIVMPNVWAKIVPVNGGEAFAQGVARNTQFYDVTIRFRRGVTPAMRIIWREVVLNIRTCADPDQMREVLLLRCESGAPEPA